MTKNGIPVDMDKLPLHSYVMVKIVRRMVGEGSYDDMEFDDEAVAGLLDDINDC